MWQKQSQGIIIVLKHYLQIIFFPSHDLSSFPLCPFDSPIFFKQSFLFVYFLVVVNNFLTILMVILLSDMYEGQPRLKYIFNICGTTIYFFTLQRFGIGSSPNFKIKSWPKIRALRGIVLELPGIVQNYRASSYAQVKPTLRWNPYHN